MLVTLNVDLENASSMVLAAVANVTEDSKVLHAMAKTQDYNVVKEILANPNVLPKTLDAVARSITNSDLIATGKIGIFVEIMLMESCAERTIRYILKQKSHQSMHVDIDGKLLYDLVEFSWRKVPNFTFDTLMYLIVNKRVNYRTIRQIFSEITLDDEQVSKLVSSLKKMYETKRSIESPDEIAIIYNTLKNNFNITDDQFYEIVEEISGYIK